MMSVYRIEPIDLGKIRTYPLASRPSKVRVDGFARPHRPGAGLSEFLDSLPHILAAEALRSVLRAISEARSKRRAILWGMGGHVIKVGLAPVLIDLLERGYVTGLAMTESAVIHDFEIAMVGSTSEDVEAQLGRGKFGMAEETGVCLNEMAREAARARIGLGEAAGKLLNQPRLKARYRGKSLLAAAYRMRIPVTVHVAIGTDIPHMHPSADGAALGAASYHDFRLLCSLVRKMHPGGVYLNWGSAVILPEVFLKAVSVARNLGTPLRGITTANFDFIQHYRGQQNVVRRPAMGPPGRARQTAGGQAAGYAITGHHEILLPLVAAALVESSRLPRHADSPGRLRRGGRRAGSRP
jgi:hypothetical protein